MCSLVHSCLFVRGAKLVCSLFRFLFQLHWYFDDHVCMGRISFIVVFISVFPNFCFQCFFFSFTSFLFGSLHFSLAKCYTFGLNENTRTHAQTQSYFFSSFFLFLILNLFDLLSGRRLLFYNMFLFSKTATIFYGNLVLK